MTTLTKLEYQRLHAHLGRLLPPGGRPLNAAELVEVGGLQEKLARIVAELRPAEEKGELVLTWRVPRELALTLNEYAYTKKWVKKKIVAKLDEQLRTLMLTHPKAAMHGSQLRRWVRVTRFSMKQIDELSVDVLGGKMPIDALVRCGVVADDDAKHMIREARWEKTQRGNTHVLVEVWTVTTEGRPVEEPRQAPAPASPQRELGGFTKAILGEDARAAVDKGQGITQ